MSEQKKHGLSQLASMLELYLQQEVTSPLPPSCREPLTLIAKVSWMHRIVFKHTKAHRRCDAVTHLRIHTHKWAVKTCVCVCS